MVSSALRLPGRMAAITRQTRTVFARMAIGVAMLAWLAPLYVMVSTSLKPMEALRSGDSVFAVATAPTLAPWHAAWSQVCATAACTGLQQGFSNSLVISAFATLATVGLGCLSGYALAFWRARGARAAFAILLAGAFIPVQVMIYPLVKLSAWAGIYGTLEGIVAVHVIFGLPIMTLLFRNHFRAVPADIFQAARIDGAGFFATFTQVMLPLAVPMIAVASILQWTGVWNDYLLGLVFAGSDNQPMTVQLNNLINTTTGERQYDVEMAAALVTSLVPLLIYAFFGRWFVRGITAGAVKG